MSVTYDGNVIWLSNSEEVQTIINKGKNYYKIGTKAIVLNPSPNSPSFYIYTASEEWESMG